MKFFAYIFFFLLIVSCTRRNTANEDNWSRNESYKKAYGDVKTRMPIQNIPYVVRSVEENTGNSSNDQYEKDRMMDDARYSYALYENDVNQMRDIMSKVTDRIKTQTYDQAGGVKYIYDKKAGDYVVDPDSMPKSIDVPTLQDRYNVNSRMHYKTSIPVDNAYAVLQMQYEGYVPNEQYFKNLSVNNTSEVQSYEYVGAKYQKTEKKDIYMNAGGISQFVNKVYDNLRTKD